MKTGRSLSIAFASILFASHVATHAQESSWSGIWSGLWEGKTQAEVTINNDGVRYRMLGQAFPVSDVRMEGTVLTFSVGLNGEHSTIVLRRTDAGADAAFMSPGGSRHEGRFVNLASQSPHSASVDSTPTGSISTPAPEDLRKR